MKSQKIDKHHPIKNKFLQRLHFQPHHATSTFKCLCAPCASAWSYVAFGTLWTTSPTCSVTSNLGNHGFTAVSMMSMMGLPEGSGNPGTHWAHFLGGLSVSPLFGRFVCALSLARTESIGTWQLLHTTSRKKEIKLENVETKYLLRDYNIIRICSVKLYLF